MNQHYVVACFSQLVRSDFSTRALESKELSRYLTSIIAIIQLDYRDIFSPSFGRFEKRVRTPLNINVLQRQISTMKFTQKLQLFQALLFVSCSSRIRDFTPPKTEERRRNKKNNLIERRGSYRHGTEPKIFGGI